MASRRMDDDARLSQGLVLACRLDIASFGYAPLARLASRYPHLLSVNASTQQRRGGGAGAAIAPTLPAYVVPTSNALDIGIGGRRLWTTVTPITPALAPSLGWRMVVFVPEGDLTGAVRERLYIAVGISGAIVLAVGALLAVLIRRMLARSRADAPFIVFDAIA